MFNFKKYLKSKFNLLKLKFKKEKVEYVDKKEFVKLDKEFYKFMAYTDQNLEKINNEHKESLRKEKVKFTKVLKDLKTSIKELKSETKENFHLHKNTQCELEDQLSIIRLNNESLHEAIEELQKFSLKKRQNLIDSFTEEIEKKKYDLTLELKKEARKIREEHIPKISDTYLWYQDALSKLFKRYEDAEKNIKDLDNRVINIGLLYDAQVIKRVNGLSGNV